MPFVSIYINPASLNYITATFGVRAILCSVWCGRTNLVCSDFNLIQHLWSEHI